MKTPPALPMHSFLSGQGPVSEQRWQRKSSEPVSATKRLFLNSGAKLLRLSPAAGVALGVFNPLLRTTNP